jgi:hypothetical protein
LWVEIIASLTKGKLCVHLGVFAEFHSFFQEQFFLLLGSHPPF